jgi:hypothetical protein
MAADHFGFGLKREKSFTRNMWDAWNMFGHSLYRYHSGIRFEF